MRKYPYHINDPEFARAVVESFLEIAGRPQQKGNTQKSTDKGEISTGSTILKSPVDFPNAKKGQLSSL